MKANELKCTDLRIGNWIMGIGYMRVTELKNELGNNFITASNEDVVFMDEEDNFEPIELTEKVLVKIGFIHRIGMWHFQIIEESKRIEVYYNTPIGGLVAYIDKKDKEFEKIEKFGIRYLHQLQNAYYCLTGQELEVEL